MLYKKLLILLIYYIICISEQIEAQEVISNPTMRLAINQELAEKVLGKIGDMQSILGTMSPEQIKSARENVLKEADKEKKGKFRAVHSQDFFMIEAWKGLEKSETQNIEILHLEKANEACFRFNFVNNTQFIFTHFKALEAGRTYKIVVGYNFSKIPENHKIKPLEIFLTSKNPEDLDKLKANFNLSFLSNKKDKVIDEKRKKIIQEYQENYGGNFSEDFAQEKEVKKYLTQEFLYAAKGGETYLTLGRILAKKKSKQQTSEKLQCSIYLVSIRPVYSTRDK